MKAALIVLLACIAGSMANPTATLAEIVQTGNVLFQNVIGQLQSSLLSVVQQALGSVQSLIGSLGGRFDFNSILGQFEQLLGVAANQLLGSLLGSLPSIFGGMYMELYTFLYHSLSLSLRCSVSICRSYLRYHW